MHYRLDVSRGLQSAPAALNKLFAGTNTGKVLVQLGDEWMPGTAAAVCLSVCIRLLTRPLAVCGGVGSAVCGGVG